ncbi:MAG: zinc-ribbon domain-containing protein [Thermoplasmata archaeon]|nr:zinc ribbon domain-containing protein [Thermoplasmata archaeon]NIS11780.1 zinc ribbon domain-containing protein [Thermoplasmata archaeon]NIV78433.1 zinc-ribbon domain-containing protein [Thermoplasmata archaeon]NIW91184.1 zinc-ribbon domain-containing protein [Thermoplasmata archaeon]
MTDGPCASCGAELEVDASFCANCGTAIGAAGTMAPPPTMPTAYMRPPRNPRQTASYAAGAMILVSGVFGLIFGNMVLYWDAWDTQWDWETEEDITVINMGAFFSGAMFVSAFAVSLVSTYCALRLTRYQLAVAGPVMLLVAYFGTLAYEPFLMVITVYILILSVVSLALLYYAIPVYEGRKARESDPRTPLKGRISPPVE